MLINSSEFQLSGVKLHLDNNTFNLYNIYNQPSSNYDLANLMQVLPNIHEDCLLVGDFIAYSAK